jgi:hypothetical protein
VRSTAHFPARSLIGALVVVATTGSLLLGTLLRPVSTFAQLAATRPVVCSVQYIYGYATCYVPRDVAKAERQVAFARRPSAVVYRILHLRLAQVGVRLAQVGDGTNPPDLRIEYIFGTLVPGGDYGRAPAQPKSVVVREDRGRAIIRPSKYLQRVDGMAMEISPAALNHPYRTYGPWFLSANFPHRNVTLSIIANISQTSLKRLALGILRR